MITMGDIQQQISKGKPYVLLLLKIGPTPSGETPEDEKRQMEHLQHLFKLKQQGKLPLFGPVSDENSNLRGIGIFDLPSVEEAEKLIKNDPHIQGGYLSYELYPWFGIRGDTLP